MTDELQAPVVTQALNPMDIQVETNSAPVEQQSTETVTEEPALEHVPDPVIKPEENDYARKAIEADIRAQAAEAKLKELTPTPKTFEKEPNWNDYSTMEDFLKDYKVWAESTGEKRANDSYSAKQQETERLKLQTAVRTKAEESRAKHADFDQVVKPLVNVMDSIPVLSDFIAKNPMGTEIAYELAKNPALLEQIRSHDIWQAGETLLNMAARLKKPTVIAQSNAPEPIKPVGSREVAKPRLSTMTDAAYIETRNKQELAKRRAN